MQPNCCPRFPAVCVQQCSAHAGLVQEVALKHKGTNIVGHNAFQDTPLGKVLKGAVAAVGGGLAVAVMNGDGPKDVLNVIKAAAKGAGHVLSSDVAAVGQAGSAVQTAVEHLPFVGKVVAKSVMDVIVSGAGEHELDT